MSGIRCSERRKNWFFLGRKKNTVGEKKGWAEHRVWEKEGKYLQVFTNMTNSFFLPWAWTPWFSLCVFFFYFSPLSPSSSLSPPSIEGASLAFRQLFSFREFWRRLSKSEKLSKGNCRTSIALKMYVAWGQSKKIHKYWWCLTFYSEKGQTEAHGQTWP